MPFQGATYVLGICPRVSLPAVACPGLGAFALSGRNLCVGLLSQGVAPCSRLPWAGSYCPFRARNDSALFYLLMATLRNVPNGSMSAASAFCVICVIRVKILFRVRQKISARKIHEIPAIRGDKICFYIPPSPPTSVLPLTQGKSAECPEW